MVSTMKTVQVHRRLRPSLFLFIFVLATVLLLNSNAVNGKPMPQDEGSEEDEVVEAGDGDSTAGDSGGEAAVTSGGEASETGASEAAAGAGAAAGISSPTGERPEGLATLLDGGEPGAPKSEDVADAGEGEVKSEGEGVGVGGDGTGSSGAAEAGGVAAMLAGLQKTLEENAGHVAVGGVALVGVVCTVAFSSKIVGLLQGVQDKIPDISSIANELKKLDPTGQSGNNTGNGKGGGDGGGGQDGPGGGGGSKSPEEAAGVMGKFKSMFQKKKDEGAGNADESLKDVATKKNAFSNASTPEKKKLLRKPDEIRQALKNQGGRGNDRLSGISEGDENADDLIGGKNLQQSGKEQISKLGNIMDNPEQLKELENIVKKPQELEKLGEIMRQSSQLRDISNLVDKPEQLRALDNIVGDPSNLEKLERSIEASEKLEEMNNTLGRAQRLVDELELQKLKQQPSSFGDEAGEPVSTFSEGLFSKPAQSSSSRGDATDSYGNAGSGERGGTASSSAAASGEKSEAIRRLDDILAKYSTDGQYGEGRSSRGAAAGGLGYSEGYGSSGGSASAPGSRSNTLTRAASGYDDPYGIGRDFYGSESLSDVQPPKEFDDDEGSSSLEDPKIVAETAKRQSKVASGIPGRSRTMPGIASSGSGLSTGRTRPGSPNTVALGKVVPAQSAISAARRLPQPTARTAAARAIAGGRSSSPSTVAGIHRPKPRTSSLLVGRDQGEDYNSSGDEFGRRSGRAVQFRPEFEDSFLQSYQQSA